MEYRLEDCLAVLDNGVLTLENSRIRRRFDVRMEGLVPIEIADLRGNAVYSGSPEELPVIPSGFGADETPSITLTAEIKEESLTVALSYTEGECAAEFQFFLAPHLPFCSLERRFKGEWGFAADPESANTGKKNGPTGIESASPPREADNEDALDAAFLPKEHFTLETIQLFDKTDVHDNLTRSFTQSVYKNAVIRERGNLFLFTNRLSGRGLLFIKESPTHLNALNDYPADAAVQKGVIKLLGSGLPEGGEGKDLLSYGSTVGVGESSRIFAEYKRYYALQWSDAPKQSFCMSNTWGDRHQDLAVCEEFMLREIDMAEKIGIDIVQIDDGWQKGVTANSARRKGGVWEGYYSAEPDFWTVNPEKFPRGMKPVADYAASKGIRLGLWFSPDSSRDFRNWRRDADTLITLHRQFGIAFFKLDGVKLRTKAAERNYFSLLARLRTESKGKLQFNQDITAEDRAGYLWQKQYGTLFVENRYSASASYYPHNTLKNLWTLTRYFPARKFQFELLNPALNQSLYGNDPLAPAKMSAAYAFACVMLANPLFWMELQHLTPGDAEELRKITEVFRTIREELSVMDVQPIGRMPDGGCLTGFQAESADGKGFFLLFREPLAPSSGILPIHPVASPAMLRPLATNLKSDEFDVVCDGEWLQLTMEKPSSYLLLHYSK